MADSVDNIKVAVRMRPLNGREVSRNATACVEMIPDLQQTVITDPATGQKKRFTFDYSYDSSIDPEDPSFASQDTVWLDLGMGVLETAWQGFNVSLFAYGQTGSGKSFSMMGATEPKEQGGVIPRACEEIFNRIDQAQLEESKNGDELSYSVEASMLEIYNEKVRDLFNPSSNNSSLRIRENPNTGPYAEGLSRNVVSSFKEISSLMEAGAAARTVAATQMNATSSRAHTIFQVILTQTITNKETMSATDKVSRINLIDLAGSERANSTGASGDRLREGSAINQSLSTLGNCISKLAENSSSGRSKFVPYRNSALTLLLKDSLGGNARTIMIAAISPADINFGETLSTLRYADRAKQIKNKAVVNEDPNEKLIRELKDEITRLRDKVVDTGVATAPPPSEGLREKEKQELLKQVEAEKEAELALLREKLEASERLLVDSQKTWAEKLRETDEVTKRREAQLAVMGLDTRMDASARAEKARSVPHLVNLNEDPGLNESLQYFLEEGDTRFGRRDADIKQDVIIGGVGVMKEHCIVENQNDAILLYAKDANGAEPPLCYVNGNTLQPGKDNGLQLNHSDRIVIGHNLVFKLNHPNQVAQQWRAGAGEETKDGNGDAAAAVKAKDVSWEMAMKEVNQKLMSALDGEGGSVSSGETPEMVRQREEQEREEKRLLEEKLEALEVAVKAERDKAEKDAEDQRVQFEAETKELQMELKRMADSHVKTNESELSKVEEKERELKQQQDEVALQFDLQRKEMLERQAKLEQALAQQIEETKRLAEKKQHDKLVRSILEERLMTAIPMVHEANSLSEEMDKEMYFEIKLKSKAAHEEVIGGVGGGGGGGAGALNEGIFRTGISLLTDCCVLEYSY
jgi:kinesin family protein 1